MRKISLVTHYLVSSKEASLPEGITMSFVPFENFLIHVELSHCSDLLQKHEPSLELQNDEPFGNSVLQSWPGFLWKVLCYPGVFKFLCELTVTNCSLFWGNSYWNQQTMGRLKAGGGWVMPQTNSFPMLAGDILRINPQMLNIAETAKIIHQLCLYSQKYQGYAFSNLVVS